MTTGESILETIDLFSKLGHTVKYVYTIFQRGKLNYNIFLNRNINYNYLTSYPKSFMEKSLELVPLHPIYKKLYDISKLKQSNLILSIDKINPEVFKNILVQCADYIVAVKVHLDIFNDEDKCHIRSTLYNYKKRFNFIVIEDRKFADICSTNIQQYNALNIEKYADIIICHAITGFEFVKHIDLPVLLVTQLSNSGNLITNDYTYKCLNGVINNFNIIGCISQENLGYNKCIYCKPGVRIGNIKNDNLDQKYTGLTNGIDYYIVGRGITNSNNIKQECLNYKNELWDYVCL